MHLVRAGEARELTGSCSAPVTAMQGRPRTLGGHAGATPGRLTAWGGSQPGDAPGEAIPLAFVSEEHIGAQPRYTRSSRLQ